MSVHLVAGASQLGRHVQQVGGAESGGVGECERSGQEAGQVLLQRTPASVSGATDGVSGGTGRRAANTARGHAAQNRKHKQEKQTAATNGPLKLNVEMDRGHDSQFR